MKDINDQSTVDFLDDIDVDRAEYNDEQRLYAEYEIAVNVISKVMREGLSKTDMRILHKILADNKFDNSTNFPMNQTGLASALFMQQPNIARSLKKLIAAQMIQKLPNGNYQLLITLPFNYSKK